MTATLEARRATKTAGGGRATVRSRTAARTVGVLARPAPALDPPYEDLAQPPAGMEPLPIKIRALAALAVDAADLDRATTTTQPAEQRAAIPPPTTARAAMRHYVGMCIEVLNGYRPATQLRPLTDGQRFGDVADQLLRRTVRVRMSPGQAARHGRLVRVRRMLVCEPVDGVAEAAVVLEQGDACWAMAVRMERDEQLPRPRIGAGWRCTLVCVI